MLRLVIIEDEVGSLNYLQLLLEKECKNVIVCGTAGSVEEGVILIEKTTPDVVLLDVMLSGPSSGFDLLNRFSSISFEVIFTTAHDDFALQAIKASAIDYLLKPIKRADLLKALEKAEKRTVEKGKKYINRIVIRGDKRNFILLQPHDIIRVEANGKKLSFVLKDNRKIETVENLSAHEGLLCNNGFLRSHRSHIINLEEVIEFLPDRNGGFLRMSDNKLVPLALSKKDEFVHKFQF